MEKLTAVLKHLVPEKMANHIVNMPPKLISILVKEYLEANDDIKTRLLVLYEPENIMKTEMAGMPMNCMGDDIEEKECQLEQWWAGQDKAFEKEGDRDASDTTNTG